MSDAEQNPETVSDSAAARKRKGPPTWGVVLFLVLLGGMVIINQLMTTTDEPIEWVEDDLDAARARAAAENTFVFLYLYQPDHPLHERNELNFFTQRWAHDPLQHVICCRIAIDETDLDDLELARRFGYDELPLIVLLDADGEPVAPVKEGAIDQKGFRVSVAEHIRRMLAERSGGE